MDASVGNQGNSSIVCCVNNNYLQAPHFFGEVIGKRSEGGLSMSAFN